MHKLENDQIPEHLPISRSKNTMLRVGLLALKVGEVLFLPKDEWRAKNTPYYIVRYIKKTHGYRFDYGFKTDGTGWLFKRIE